MRAILWPLGCGLVLGASLLVYAPAINGGLVWDDPALVSGEAIGGGDTLSHALTRPFLNLYYRPLVSISFFIERQIWHQNPLGYHVTNLLLHLLATGALIALLRSVFDSKPAAVGGGLIFAVHPAQTGAVAWIGGRTDALCVLWVTLFAWSVIEAARSSGDRRSFLLTASLLAYLAAIFTKEQAIALALLVPPAFRCSSPRVGFNEPRAGWWAALPFGIAALLYLVMDWFLGITKPAGMPGIGDVISRAGQTITYYVLVLLTPTPRWLNTYSLSTLQQAGIWPILFGYAALAISIALIRNWNRHPPQSAIRNPQSALPWFLALSLLSLLPVGNFLAVPYLNVAPYRASSAVIGLAAIVGWAAGALWSYAGPRGRVIRAATAIAFALMAIGWGTLTIWGTAQWRSDEQFFTTIARHDPESILAHFNLARVYGDTGRCPAALAESLEMLRILGSSEHKEVNAAALDSDPEIRRRIAVTLGIGFRPSSLLAGINAHLGYARYGMGDLKSALEAYRTGGRLDPTNPYCKTGIATCEREMARGRGL